MKQVMGLIQNTINRQVHSLVPDSTASADMIEPEMMKQHAVLTKFNGKLSWNWHDSQSI